MGSRARPRTHIRSGGDARVLATLPVNVVWNVHDRGVRAVVGQTDRLRFPAGKRKFLGAAPVLEA